MLVPLVTLGQAVDFPAPTSRILDELLQPVTPGVSEAQCFLGFVLFCCFGGVCFSCCWLFCCYCCCWFFFLLQLKKKKGSQNTQNTMWKTSGNYIYIFPKYSGISTSVLTIIQDWKTNIVILDRGKKVNLHICKQNMILATSTTWNCDVHFKLTCFFQIIFKVINLKSNI